jgi:hypothetical protein
MFVLFIWKAWHSGRVSDCSPLDCRFAPQRCTDKTPDVDFRTYNRMPQGQTVQGAENVSCLWAAEIHLHFRSFPPNSEFSGDFPEVFGNFRRFFGNFQRFSQRKNKKVRMSGDNGGDRTHILRITNLILYLPATDALCIYDK